MSGEESAREAAERNARAVKEGNITQVMADITPEALAQMMQMASSAATSGIPTPTSMPGIESYTIEPTGEGEDSASFNVSFTSAAGSATVATTWKRIAGQWKISGVALVSADPAGNPPPAAAG